ncbi:MAG: integration host factor subunit beta [Desulfovibrionaceae bacterium]|nr:integration host factor subunit beta [Desulfovibrionaceae bacterium]
MNKSELIHKLAMDADIPLEEAYDVVNVLIETLTNAMLEGRRIEIRGFGSFQLKQYKGYLGKNPKTGEKISVSPKILPCFRAGKELKDLVNS